MEVNAKLLSDHIVSSNEAMKILFQNGHHESALILLYSWVDRLAWLSVDKEQSTGIDVKDWLNHYLFVDGVDFEFNANDIWAARCALLHTGTSQARDVQKGNAREVLYCGGQMKVTARKPKEQVYVHIGDLHVGLLNASLRFLQYLEKHPEDLSRVNSKLGKVLRRTTDF